MAEMQTTRLARARRLGIAAALALGATLYLWTVVGDARSAPVTQPFDPARHGLVLRPVARGFQFPVHVTHAPDGSGRLFVVERRGTIRIVDRDGVRSAPFLDITSEVGSRGQEQGLLGLAFHPAYRDNGLFYVNYTDLNGDTVVARYQASADPNAADPATWSLVLYQPQPFANHNGGNLVFGPDGYLWIGLGDGGSRGDPANNAQNGQTWLGKMLRIDVNSGEPYAVPWDNPYVDVPGVLPEVWAMGLRNPWRYSFDRATGDLFIADVGQGAWEEVHVTPAGTPGGVNYGWSILEGGHCYRVQPCDPAGLDLPVAEYDHALGCSITGGYVYRGSSEPLLAGAYLFGDFCSGRIWSLVPRGDGGWVMQELADTAVAISSFGEDEAGELYVAGYADGVIYRVGAVNR